MKFYLCFSLDAVHADAYTAFMSTRDLEAVLNQVLSGESKHSGTLSIGSKVMTPVQPMLVRSQLNHRMLAVFFLNTVRNSLFRIIFS